MTLGEPEEADPAPDEIIWDGNAADDNGDYEGVGW